MSYKQQKLISLTSGSWKSEVRALAWSHLGEGSLPGLTPDLCPHVVEQELVSIQATSLVPLALTRFMRSPNAITLGVKVQHRNSGVGWKVQTFNP